MRSTVFFLQIVAVFSENLVTKIEGALKNAVEQQFLRDVIKRLIQHLVSAITTGGMSQKDLLRLLERCDKVSPVNFDHLTGTKLTEGILAKLNARGVTKLLTNVRLLSTTYKRLADNKYYFWGTPFHCQNCCQWRRSMRATLFRGESLFLKTKCCTCFNIELQKSSQNSKMAAKPEHERPSLRKPDKLRITRLF